jgi:hypothetical protein
MSKMTIYRDRLSEYPHDRKGGGLVVIILDFCRETLFECPFQIVFSHSPRMAKRPSSAGSARRMFRDTPDHNHRDHVHPPCIKVGDEHERKGG